MNRWVVINEKEEYNEKLMVGEYRPKKLSEQIV